MTIMPESEFLELWNSNFKIGRVLLKGRPTVSFTEGNCLAVLKSSDEGRMKHPCKDFPLYDLELVNWFLEWVGCLRVMQELGLVKRLPVLVWELFFSLRGATAPCDHFFSCAQSYRKQERQKFQAGEVKIVRKFFREHPEALEEVTDRKIPTGYREMSPAVPVHRVLDIAYSALIRPKIVREVADLYLERFISKHGTMPLRLSELGDIHPPTDIENAVLRRLNVKIKQNFLKLLEAQGVL